MQDAPIVTSPTSDIFNFCSQANGHGASDPAASADMTRSGSLIHTQLSKLRTEHQRENSLPLPDSDPTCTPPTTAGRPRTLILCFDGTGDQYDEDNTNIVHIFSFLKKDDRDIQMCYYQPGIGTYTDHQHFLGITKTIERLWDSAVAWSLHAHVQGGYEFLMQNYKDGDRICLFGFSRGAYTARALAGMLHKVGLLPAYNKQQVPFAWKLYTQKNADLSQEFKKLFCADVKIDFLGVFDTVSSVGMFGKTLPFAASNYSIRIFRHAIALDERRARFKVAHWHSFSEKDFGTCSSNSWVLKKKRMCKSHEHGRKEVEDDKTDVKEVWFAGCHCDVGGGNVKNDERNCLAKIPLRWMIRETFRCHTGILWNIEALRRIGLDEDKLHPKVIVPQLESASPSNSLTPGDLKKEDVASDTVNDEHQDAFSQIKDQLTSKRFWWLVEVIPAKHKIQRPHPHDPNTWEDKTTINFGRGRLIPRSNDGVLIHRSVSLRMERDPKYKWKAIGELTPVWTD